MTDLAALIVTVCVISDHIECRPADRWIASIPYTLCMSQGQSAVAAYMTKRPWLRLVKFRCETGAEA